MDLKTFEKGDQGRLQLAAGVAGREHGAKLVLKPIDNLTEEGLRRRVIDMCCWQVASVKSFASYHMVFPLRQPCRTRCGYWSKVAKRRAVLAGNEHVAIH